MSRLIESSSPSVMLRLIGWGMGVYPVIAHLGLWTSLPRLAVSYLICLLLIVLLHPPHHRQLKNIVFASALIISVACLVAIDRDYLLIYLPPVIIPGMFMLLFLRSLRKGSIPLITQFQEQIKGKELSIERKNYTRKVTILWAAIFVFMILEALLVALLAPIEVWSWVTHIGNYVLIGLVLLIEFIYRKHRFKTEQGSFKQFILALSSHRWN